MGQPEDLGDQMQVPEGEMDMGDLQGQPDGGQIPDGNYGQMQGDDDQGFGIDPNQQINNDFLGSNQPYGGDIGDDQMGLGGQGDGQIEEDADEYFDDAGDIGYLPADHVSFIF